LLIQAVPGGRGNPPAGLKVPEGPIIQESDGKKAPVRTYEDLLQDRHDEDLFDYYATSQLELVHPHVGHLGPVRASAELGGKNLGKPAGFAGVETSAVCQHNLFRRIVRPY